MPLFKSKAEKEVDKEYGAKPENMPTKEPVPVTHKPTPPAGMDAKSVLEKRLKDAGA